MHSHFYSLRTPFKCFKFMNMAHTVCRFLWLTRNTDNTDNMWLLVCNLAMFSIMQNCELKIYTAKLLLLAVWANLTMHMCRFFLQHCNNSKLQDFQLFHWNRGRYLSKGPCTSPREGGLNYQTISSLQLASRVPLSQPNQMKRCLTTSNAQRNNMLHPVSNKSCVKGQT